MTRGEVEERMAADSEAYAAWRQQARKNLQSWLGAGSINIFGPPLAGKDTQCKLLAEWTGGVVLSGGDILRHRPDLPPRVREIMERGELIPIDDYLAIVTPYLGDERFAGQPLIFSAVGRFSGEEPAILQAAKAAGHPVKAVVELKVRRETVLKHWLARTVQPGPERPDDSVDAFHVRQDEFEQKTLPVIDYYRRLGLLVSVSGEGSIESVSSRLLNALHDYAFRG